MKACVLWVCPVEGTGALAVQSPSPTNQPTFGANKYVWTRLHCNIHFHENTWNNVAEMKMELNIKNRCLPRSLETDRQTVCWFSVTFYVKLHSEERLISLTLACYNTGRAHFCVFVFHSCFQRFLTRQVVRICVCVSGYSIIHSYIAKQVRHGLPVVDAANGLWQDHADVYRLDLWTLELLQLVRNRVGHHHLEQRHVSGKEREGPGEPLVRRLTSSIADSSINLGASEERMPCVAMTKIL